MIAPQRTSSVEETRARILAATREIFERNGTRGTTTREVAERAGVNEATLFRHFGSKAALIGAMREDSCGVEIFRAFVANLTGDDIAADLEALSSMAIDRMSDQRALMCVSLAEDAVAPEAPDFLAPEWRGPQAILSLLTDYFAARAAENRLHGEPGYLGRMFMGMLFQRVVARKLWGYGPIDETAIRGIVDVFLNGVKV